MIRLGLLILLPVGLVLACGGADHSSPFARPIPSSSGGQVNSLGGQGGEMPMPPASGGISSGGSPSFGGEGGVPLGGSGMGGSGEPRCESDGTPPPDSVLFVCQPPRSVNDLERQPVATGPSWLVGATPDELTLVWGSPGATRLRYFIAERGTTAYDFGEQIELTVEDVPLSLSSDGLRLALMAVDGKTLKEKTRGARGESFGDVAEGPFASLNDWLAAHPSERILALTLAQDDLNLAYLTFNATSESSTLYVGQRSTSSEPFEVGEPLPDCETQGDSAAGRYPTSFSADGLTLFYYDEVRGVPRAAYREKLSSPFQYFVDVPGQGGLHVNQDCTRGFVTPSSRSDAIRLAEIRD
jgi:hypothetical protein